LNQGGDQDVHQQRFEPHVEDQIVTASSPYAKGRGDQQNGGEKDQQLTDAVLQRLQEVSTKQGCQRSGCQSDRRDSVLSHVHIEKPAEENE